MQVYWATYSVYITKFDFFSTVIASFHFFTQLSALQGFDKSLELISWRFLYALEWLRLLHYLDCTTANERDLHV